MTAARILAWLIVAAGAVLVTAAVVPVIVGLRRGRPFGDPDGSRCCDLHNHHCEPPSELCCEDCTEANHPIHPAGERCTWLAGTA